MPRKPSVVRDALAADRTTTTSDEPTSTQLSDYTIRVVSIEGGWWQAHLEELPSVITTHRTWSGLRQYLQDALVLYQSARQ